MFWKKKKKKTQVTMVPIDAEVEPSRQNKVFFYALLVLAIYLSLLVFAPFAVPVITGLLLAYLAFPIYRFFRTIARIRALAAALALLFILSIIVVPLAALGIAFADEARDFATNLSTTEPPEWAINALDLWLATQVDDPNNVTQIQEERSRILDTFLTDASAFLIERIPGTLALIGDIVLGTFIVAFIMFYIFVDGERLIHFIQRTIPLPPKQSGRIIRETGNAVDAIFVGQLFSALLQGLVGGVGFMLFGVPHAFFWGTIMAILSLLPVVGAFLVWMPAVIFLLLQGETMNALWLFLWGAILVSNVDNIAKPILIGNRSDIHPILVLVGVLGGIVAFGFIGFIVGPLILAVLVTLLKVWREFYHDHNGWRRVRPGEAVTAVGATVPAREGRGGTLGAGASDPLGGRVVIEDLPADARAERALAPDERPRQRREPEAADDETRFEEVGDRKGDDKERKRGRGT